MPASARQFHRANPPSLQWACAALIALTAMLCLGLLAAPGASAANFSWSGEGSASANGWSNGANWTGGTAPASGGSIGTLSFPVLSRSSCTSGTPSEACFSAANDLTGVSVNELQVDDADSYNLTGNGFTLGAGGLATTNYAGSGGFATIATPITLSASQTWNVSGSVSGGDGLSAMGALSGSSSALTVNLTQAGAFALGGYTASTTDNEVGDVLVQGSGDFWLDATLNATDGHSVTVQSVPLFTSGASVGALAVSGSTTKLGWRASEAAVLNVASAAFTGGELDIPIVGAGTQADVDFSQLTATGTVQLTGTNLNISDDTLGGCPAVPAGQTDVLVSTTGSLSGTFANAANGSVITTECLAKFRIEYHASGSPQTVTATAVGSGGGSVPVNSAPPTISGSTIEGQTLSEAHGSWSNSPTSYSYQWQDCDSSGNNCVNVTGATGQAYMLTGADVGHTIRVQETASNAQGSGSPAISVATAVVQATSLTSGQGSTTSGSGGGSGTASGSGSGSSSTGTASVSVEQIKVSLASQLTSLGKGTKIAALLKNGGYVQPFTALEAGTLSVQWYLVPHGAKLARKAKSKAKAKPILVASGKLAFPGAGSGKVRIKLTAAGKRLLRHTKRLKLEATGTFSVTGVSPVNAVNALTLRQ